MVQTCLFGTKHGTQLYLVYIIVLIWLESKKIVIYLILHAKLRFKVFFSVFSTLSYKLVQTWFVCDESWHTTPFGLIFFAEMVRINITC